MYRMKYLINNFYNNKNCNFDITHYPHFDID